MPSPRLPLSPAAYIAIYVVGLPGLLAAIAYLAGHSGLDLTLARYFYDPISRRFPLSQLPTLELLGHQAVLALPLGLAAVALIGLALAALRPRLHAWLLPCALLLTAMAAVPLLIAVLKNITALPRPYRLQMFGGDMLMPTRWWAGGTTPAGHALPSHHAAAGYSLGLLYFVGWATRRPALRWGGLALGLILGAALSSVRIMQGAHFLSQTLWSAAVVSLIGGLCFLPLLRAEPGPVRTQ
ncbi:phosphatase PAP2 family protein [Bordetella genomosp. 12]|uniref:Phosphatidic acid phosphatase type 2/haloperoxidase domain-containing protein n=1 Tax=Bordetella genomosp. 12 TaxID=463035 RepID=A0A261VAH1_9BORD|nr:phosphatase PAP2 family protein [Bordetella genomosp. 12]OZI70807.1 hypothetical protein CAL22_12945 [Bordetella genomosp. 12]